MLPRTNNLGVGAPMGAELLKCQSNNTMAGNKVQSWRKAPRQPSAQHKPRTQSWLAWGGPRRPFYSPLLAAWEEWFHSTPEWKRCRHMPEKNKQMSTNESFIRGRRHSKHTCTSSSLLLKCETRTFSPSVTRVREMPNRPLAWWWQSAGSVRPIMWRTIFIRLKEGCIGPRNRFRASFATSMMLAPVSPADIFWWAKEEKTNQTNVISYHHISRKV